MYIYIYISIQYTCIYIHGKTDVKQPNPMKNTAPPHLKKKTPKHPPEILDLTTWRIIPCIVRGDRITSIYKPWISAMNGRGTTRCPS